jgi:uncharacterized protein YbjT (DUF2867 family)
MITVMGATGNTGRAIAEKLLAKGEKVRAIVRNKEKAKDLAAKGAELVAGNVTDAKFLASAFKGADAVYTLLPPNAASPDFGKYQDEIGVATAQAIAEAGVKKVVLLSSIGADKPSGNGPIAGLWRQEKRLRELAGVDTLALRPAYFMENVGGNLGMIKHQGINGGAVEPNVKFPLIATADIAEAATNALLARDWKGFEVRELHGPREYSMAEITSILGRKIGKSDLRYVTFPYEDFTKALVGFGFSQSVAGMYAEMSKAFNEGTVKPVESRSARNTTPTTFESFADGLAKAYASL